LKTRKHIWTIVGRFLALFMPIALSVIVGAFYMFDHEERTALINLSQLAALRLDTGSIKDLVKTATSDIAYLSEHAQIVTSKRWKSEDTISHLGKDWVAFSRAKQIYDQVRHLDEEGNELVRVNWNKTTPYIVTQKNLQNKFGRYYFTDTLNLNRGEIFISPLDLNIEGGRVELPQKPTIRIGMPITTSSGDKKSIVLLNYRADKIISTLKLLDDGQPSSSWLINSEGYWLKGPNSELEWGFMFQRPNANMSTHHKHAWDIILAKDAGQFEDSDGLWTYATVYPLAEGTKTSSGSFDAFSPSRSALETSKYYWKVVRFMPSPVYRDISKKTSNRLLVLSSLILTLFVIGSWLLALSWTRQRLTQRELFEANKNLEHKISKRTKELNEAKLLAEQNARLDPLTGLSNRRGFNEVAGKIHDFTCRYGHSYSIILLDIDFFKKVNDTYGHQMGDVALKTFANTILATIRTSDIAARFGGEEFVVILPETTSKEAKEPLQEATKLADRLRIAASELKLPYKDDVITFTISCGVSTHDGKDKSFESVIRKADKALYKAKESGRNRVVTFDAIANS